MKNIVIINYGSGNIHSAKKAFEKVVADNNLNLNVTVTDDAKELEKAAYIIVPGVGSFGDCVAGIKKIPKMVDAIKDQVLNNKNPFLGICVGMQMLAQYGYEHGKFEGLGLIEGEVAQIEIRSQEAEISKKTLTTNYQLPTTCLKLPHMGWNNLVEIKKNKITEGFTEKDDFYFVHSYHFITDDRNVTAKVNYGSNITAIVNKDNIWGVQFHPEKSQKTGQKIIKNFLNNS